MSAEAPTPGTYLRRGARMVEVLGPTMDGEGIEVQNIVTEYVSELPLDTLEKWVVVQSEGGDGC